MNDPKGALVIVGGHEERDPDGARVILREVARRIAGGKLVLATVASGEPEGYVEEYTRAFADLGLGELIDFHVLDRDEANDPARLSAFDDAAGVFFTGGDQKRLLDAIADTPVAERVRAIYAQGGVIAGTSAGASAMSETMIARGAGSHSPAEGEVRFARGLGLLPDVVIDQHFAERGRMGRLMAAVAETPASLGLGIDENTAVIVEAGNFRVIGAGGVTVVEGGTLRPSTGPERDVITIVDARVHLLGAEDRYDLRARRPLQD